MRARVAAALLVGALAASWAPAGRPQQDAPAERSAAAWVQVLDDPAEGPQALGPAFEAFLAAMESYRGDDAVAIARAMHRRALAVRAAHPGYDVLWSAFCLEGALRRTATAGTAAAHHREARAALDGLLSEPGLDAEQRAALHQRVAILEAGFGHPAAERRALGAALGLHGVDGAQISGLAALGRPGGAPVAARLFASLLDGGPERAAAPWALRGHALAVFEGLRPRAR